MGLEEGRRSTNEPARSPERPNQLTEFLKPFGVEAALDGIRLLWGDLLVEIAGDRSAPGDDEECRAFEEDDFYCIADISECREVLGEKGGVRD